MIDIKRLLGLLVVACVAVAASGQDRPSNIVLIISDDAGYEDFSFQGSEEIQTPHLDALAASGVVCSQAYVSASVCSPSRAGLLTGRHQQRFGHEMNLPPKYSEVDGLSLDETLFPAFLQQHGYRTIALGKWHLGYSEAFHPCQRGFDDYFGFLQGSRSFYPIQGTRLNRLLRDQRPVEERFTYMTDELAEQAAAYVNLFHDEPFFMYLSFNAVHTPMHALEEDLAGIDPSLPAKRRKLIAMTIALDRAVGRVMQELEEHDLIEDTMVIFINDNGGATNNACSNGTLRGRKGSPFEGGLRVPLVFSMPGTLPAGATYEHPVSALDIGATALGLAAVPAPEEKPFDGVNILDHLMGINQDAPHQTMFWRRGHDMAIRHGDWKLLKDGEDGERMLFHIGDDPNELNNLAADQPQRVEQLLELWNAWAAEMVLPAWRWGTN